MKHHARCGAVGKTGEHGDLGSNAAEQEKEAAVTQTDGSQKGGEVNESEEKETE